MAIRLRVVDGKMVALCAAETEEKLGDVYLDDTAHYALTEKFDCDFVSEGWKNGLDVKQLEADLDKAQEEIEELEADKAAMTATGWNSFGDMSREFWWQNACLGKALIERDNLEAENVQLKAIAERVLCYDHKCEHRTDNFPLCFESGTGVKCPDRKGGD